MHTIQFSQKDLEQMLNNLNMAKNCQEILTDSIERGLNIEPTLNPYKLEHQLLKVYAELDSVRDILKCNQVF